MLYDPKWEKRFADKLADPFTLESLIAWLEQQPASGPYEWADIRNCLLMQYFQAKGYKGAWGGSTLFYHGWFQMFRKGTAIPEPFVTVAVCQPNTYGAALTRAREALSR